MRAESFTWRTIGDCVRTDGAGLTDAPDGALDGLGLQLLRVREVRHEGDVLAALDDLLEEAEEIVGVLVREEAIGPVAECLAAEADRADVLELGESSGST